MNMMNVTMYPRAPALIAVTLISCAVIAGQEPRPSAPSENLATLISEFRVAKQLPGLAVVVVRLDGQPQVYVSGERRIGRGDAITSMDRMHLGSLTKAVTATVIGALAEQKRMTPETTISEAFPELIEKIDPAYRNVTARQLLTHASGVQTYSTIQALRPLLALRGTGPEQRYAFVERVLTEPPRFQPGSRHEYSNAGPAIAGAMAERIAGSPYRQLVQDLIFTPLGGEAAFGNPGLAATPQPWGHVRTGFGKVVEVLPAAEIYSTPLAIEPAGDVSVSLPDYGRFLQLHLRGLKGRDDVLKTSTIQNLHRRGSAMGWSRMMRKEVESHEHSGSYGAYVAFAAIQPARNIAVAAFTNMGGSQDLRDAILGLALQVANRVAANEKTN